MGTLSPGSETSLALFSLCHVRVGGVIGVCEWLERLVLQERCWDVCRLLRALKVSVFGECGAVSYRCSTHPPADPRVVWGGVVHPCAEKDTASIWRSKPLLSTNASFAHAR